MVARPPPVIEWDDRPDYLIDELIEVAPDHGNPEWDPEDTWGPYREPYCSGGELLIRFKGMPSGAALPEFTVEHYVGWRDAMTEIYSEVTWAPEGIVSEGGGFTTWRFSASG